MDNPESLPNTGNRAPRCISVFGAEPGNVSDAAIAASLRYVLTEKRPMSGEDTEKFTPEPHGSKNSCCISAADDLVRSLQLVKPRNRNLGKTIAIAQNASISFADPKQSVMWLTSNAHNTVPSLSGCLPLHNWNHPAACILKDGHNRTMTAWTRLHRWRPRARICNKDTALSSSS